MKRTMTADLEFQHSCPPKIDEFGSSHRAGGLRQAGTPAGVVRPGKYPAYPQRKCSSLTGCISAVSKDPQSDSTGTEERVDRLHPLPISAALHALISRRIASARTLQAVLYPAQRRYAFDEGGNTWSSPFGLLADQSGPCPAANAVLPGSRHWAARYRPSVSRTHRSRASKAPQDA